jgi:hypothetical protein
MTMLGSAVLLVLTASAPPAAADAIVDLLEGVPGPPIDVAVDGSCAASDLMFGDSIGPLVLTPGTHEFAMSGADSSSECGGLPLFDAPLTLEDGARVTLVAYTDEVAGTVEGAPPSQSAPATPNGVVLVFHGAAHALESGIAMHDQDVEGSPTPVIREYENGDQAVSELLPGNWYATFTPADTLTAVLEGTTVELTPGATYSVYAVGSTGAGTYRLLVLPRR